MLTENPKMALACLIIGAAIVTVGLFLACSKKFRQHYGDGFGAAMFAVGALVMLAALLFTPMKSDAKNINPSGTALMAGEVSDKLTFDELELTVNDYVFSESLGNLEGLTKANDGNVWCTIYLNVKNISKATKALHSLSNTNYTFTLVYKDGYTYHCTYQDYSEFLDAHDDIAALEELKNVCVSFEVPLEVEENASEPLSLKFSKNSRKEKDYVEWKLR
nr:MAG TPA: protein of unknown function (DUF4352) [Caudoviricetes sp.]